MHKRLGRHRPGRLTRRAAAGKPDARYQPAEALEELEHDHAERHVQSV
jgi:hypothetical protein